MDIENARVYHVEGLKPLVATKLYAGRKIVFCQKLWGKWYIPKYVKSWYIYQLILSDPDECSFQLSWDKINWYMYQCFTYFGICTTFSIIMGPSPKYWTKAENFFVRGLGGMMGRYLTRATYHFIFWSN